MSKPKPVHVTWRDAHAIYSSWSEPDSLDHTDFTCETVGWLLPSTTKPGYHVVVLSRTHEGLVGDGIAIPNDNVLSCDVLSAKSRKTP